MGNKITVTTIVLKNNFSAVKDALKKDTLAKSVMAAGHVVESYAKINAERVFSSHALQNLAGSIKTVLVKSTDTNAEADVGPHVPYGAIQEFGGIIKTVHAAWLQFQTYDGMWHMVKEVHMRAHPYLRPAVDENLDEIRDAAGEQVKRAIERGLK